ncbi:NADPH:quinone reductase-like Zn-dependent oxidoreductase [Haloactinomyces albus]|uniref:NADPH:quinone reductase-like Zn-dependent oxidoreductase n=1 Tax=Haloactinomyces albus TaxID=1352928 RepID=A0AAE3ZCZ2_9ACTN|nr:hypothetical protein [Haloactinomyces albus]MDR7301605.1 NADPH:quinone reductase-like Zn-dependent oxidoreductase [Haloactinomyces albus]
MPAHTMRAVRLHEHGGPEVLRYDEVPLPTSDPGEALVRVNAIGVNPPDWYLREPNRQDRNNAGRFTVRALRSSCWRDW